jgi:hypothetical protein
MTDFSGDIFATFQLWQQTADVLSQIRCEAI